MGTPPNAISKKEYLKFFYVIRKTKGEADLDIILNVLQKEVPVWASRQQGTSTSTIEYDPETNHVTGTHSALHGVDEKEVETHHQSYTETDVHIKPRIETLTETFNMLDLSGTGKIERADLEETMNHDRGGAFFNQMGTPPNAISKEEYLKFFYVIRKTKGEADLDNILNVLQKEVPAWRHIADAAKAKDDEPIIISFDTVTFG